MSLITDTLLAHLPAKRKHTPSGWISFNAPCCGDKRQRGGFIINAGDAVSYHCFNCQFKASWQPGRPISQKMSKLMRLLNVSDNTINQLRLEALKLQDSDPSKATQIIPKFEAKALPMDAKSLDSLIQWYDMAGGISNFPEALIKAISYLEERGIPYDSYPFYWTPKAGFNNRIVIPFYKDGACVGYTARALNDAKPKYISEQQPGYVFNLDHQHTDDKAFVIVCEGPFDALSIDGCALLGAEIKETQNMLLKQLGKEIVLVPDKDHEGPKTVEQALEYNWSVSMPDWPEGIKDVNDAIVKLGKLATMYLIVSAKEANPLKVRLKAKQWFKIDE